jgi:hypothetical protein
MADSIRLTLNDADDVIHQDIPVVVPFRYKDTDETGEEEFLARGEVPFGVLFDIEDGRPSALFNLFSAAFYDDDNDRDDDDQPISGTSSLDRWRELAGDAQRQVPGTVLRKLLETLGSEYMTRNGMRKGPARPTTRVAPSRAQRRQTGRSSPAKRGSRASISAAPEPE